MKKLLSILLLAYSGLAFGQVNLSGIDKQSFLVGTLNEYMGRQQTFTVKTDSTYYQLVDLYKVGEDSLALFIDSVFRIEYEDLRIKKNKAIKLYSKKLSAKINTYFNYVPNGHVTSSRDSIYTGTIKPEYLSTDLERLSYLAGAYLRNGGKTDANEYYFTLPNSESKAKLCAKLLTECNCLEVKYLTFNRIPVGHWITFKPSAKVLAMLQKMEPLKNGKLMPSYFLMILKTDTMKIKQ